MKPSDLALIKWGFLLGSAGVIYIAFRQLIAAYKHNVISGDVRLADNPALFWLLVIANIAGLAIMIPVFLICFLSIALRAFHA